MNERLIEAYKNVNKEVAWEFFIAFSRFEYALKRINNYRKNNKGKPEPNWDYFSTNHEDDFQHCKDPLFVKATNYFQSYPPKRQVICEDQIIWESPQNTKKSLDGLLIDIRAVRNNLFHGGKYTQGPESDSIRNSSLLEGALIILYKCLDFDSELYSVFYEGIST